MIPATSHHSSSTDGHAEVLAEEQHMRQSGMDGVPLFVINGHDRISGAQPVAVFIDTLDAIWLRRLRPTDGCDDGQCSVLTDALDATKR
jgi:predicted DsbA family dithiol-disulfide isomerase